MSGIDPKTREMVELAMSALPEEIGCDHFAEYMAAYAEQILSGKPIPAEMRPAEEHLARCKCCLEELDLLIAAMKREAASR